MDSRMNEELYDEFMYIGCVKHNSELKFFVDTINKWILDLSDYPVVPEERQNSITIDDSKLDNFLALLEIPVSLETLAKTFPKSHLTYFIDFDRKMFVDGIRRDGFDLIYSYVPVDWIAFEANPFLFVPATVRQCWLSHVIHTQGEWANSIEIPKYTTICAIHHQGSWRYYYEMPEMFILDFDQYIFGSHLQPFAQVIYKNFRGNLKVVDVSNADDYLAMLQEYEIPEGMKAITRSDADLMPEIKMRNAQLSQVIDFDKKLVVNEGYYDPRTNERKSAKLIPDGWHSLADDPKNHLPLIERALWKIIRL
jgi:hypothetical protein